MIDVDFVLRKFLNMPMGRDRSLRFLQYLSQLMSGVLDGDSATLSRRIQVALLSARRWFRIARSLEHIMKMHRIVTGPTPKNDAARRRVEMTLQFIQHLCLAIFFLIDHFVTLTRVGLLKGMDPVFLRQIASGAWLTSSVTGLLVDVSKLFRSYSDHSTSPPPHPLPSSSSFVSSSSLDDARRELYMDAARNLLDTVIGWELTVSRTFSSRQRTILGACGVVTSAIQLQQIYTSLTSGKTLAQRLALPGDAFEQGGAAAAAAEARKKV